MDYFDDDLVTGFGGNDTLEDVSKSSIQLQDEDNLEEDILDDIPAPCLATSDLNNDFSYPYEIQGLHFNVTPPTRTSTQVIHEDGNRAYNQFNSQVPGQQSYVGAMLGHGDAGISTFDIRPSSLIASAPTSESGISSDSGFVSMTICEMCGESYKNKSTRQKHIRKHIKPFMCRYLGCKRGANGFATTNDLYRHVKSVHKEGLERWWKCDYPDCSKTTKEHYFDRKDNFKAHVRRRHDEVDETELEDLVKRSEHHPSREEIARVLQTKDNRPPKSSLSRQSSTCARTMKKRQSRSERGDNVSACSPSANFDLPLPPAPLTASVPPLHSQLTDGMASMRMGAGLLEQPATSNPNTSHSMGQGKGRAFSLGTNPQSLHPRSSSMSNNSRGIVTTGAIPIPMDWQGSGPTSAPRSQQMSRAMNQDQLSYTEHPASFPSMQHGFGTTQHDQSMYMGFPGIDHLGIQASSFPHDTQIWSPSIDFNPAFNPMYDANAHSVSSFIDSASSSYVEPNNMVPSSYVEPSNVSPLSYAQPSDTSSFDMDFPFGMEPADVHMASAFGGTSFQAMNEHFDQG